MYKLSVIIPIYNSSAYLDECLLSLQNQTLRDIEIICINDGSTDNSLEIIQKYARSDKRIKIVNQENKGIGTSRNNGINIAKGECIAFVDSDDYVESNTFELTYNKAKENNSDIVVYNTKCIPNKNDILPKETEKYFNLSTYFENREVPKTFTYKEIKHKLLNVTWNIWNKIYKREFIINNNIKFINTYFQDSPFHLETMLLANKISFLNKKLYNYRLQNPNSVTNTHFLSRKIFDFFTVTDHIKHVLEKRGKYNELEKEYLEFKLIISNSHYECIVDKTIKNEFYNAIINSIKADGYSISDLKRFNFALCPEHFLNSSKFEKNFYK